MGHFRVREIRPMSNLNRLLILICDPPYQGGTGSASAHSPIYVNYVGDDIEIFIR